VQAKNYAMSEISNGPTQKLTVGNCNVVSHFNVVPVIIIFAFVLVVAVVVVVVVVVLAVVVTVCFLMLELFFGLLGSTC